MSNHFINEVDRQAVELCHLADCLPKAGPGTLLNTYSRNSKCCMGHCCFEGKKMKAEACEPHEQGVAMLTESGWTLNESILIPDFHPVEVIEQEVEGSPFDGFKIDKWVIASRISVRWKNPKFIKHPRGLLITCEEHIEGVHFIACDLLVLSA